MYFYPAFYVNPVLGYVKILKISGFPQYCLEFVENTMIISLKKGVLYTNEVYVPAKM